ncbi:hypothetical protein [Planctopirus hydrillae]|uniref:Uncharacterized protein n=1 Tax=Planctopirus hydrillae TaxID=1841610 RepID=A0A1C3E7W3_9PLAN|nr:hypothetical protein [Planctopirus hydrillae]ODA29249.1 hypothetical protein A6X21_09110 [Planctopirus hydrillae]
MLKVDGAFTNSIHDGEYHYLDVIIQNLGIPMHQVSVSLYFKVQHLGLTYTIEMQRVEYRQRHKVVTSDNEFAQGMIGAFRLNSKSLQLHDSNGTAMLKNLDNPRSCNAKIQVYSQDYLVAEFQLWHRFYWIKSRWNRFAYQINSKFNKHIRMSDGSERLKLGKVLPCFNLDSQFKLEQFVKGILDSDNRKGQ